MSLAGDKCPFFGFGGVMFSGIVEAQVPVLRVEKNQDVLRIFLARPSHFNDLKIGDSIAVDGVCLTLEHFEDTQMVFALAAETLQVTGWEATLQVGRMMNLERSLQWGDRVHGHLVTGHVDAQASVCKMHDLGESRLLEVELPNHLRSMVWAKGSVAINGVSLTINRVVNGVVELCLIPETLKKTNLSQLQTGSPVLVEIDNLARGLAHLVQSKGAEICP